MGKLRSLSLHCGDPFPCLSRCHSGPTRSSGMDRSLSSYPPDNIHLSPPLLMKSSISLSVLAAQVCLKEPHDPTLRLAWVLPCWMKKNNYGRTRYGRRKKNQMMYRRLIKDCRGVRKIKNKADIPSGRTKENQLMKQTYTKQRSCSCVTLQET